MCPPGFVQLRRTGRSTGLRSDNAPTCFPRSALKTGPDPEELLQLIACWLQPQVLTYDVTFAVVLRLYT